MALSNLYQSQLFSDLEIQCGPETFKVHRCVMACQSEFFRAALTGKFQEASSQRIDLSHDEPSTIAGMLHHLYGLDYEEHHFSQSNSDQEQYTGNDSSSTTFVEGLVTSALDTEESESLASLHARMYAVGDKYSIPTLTDLAKERFNQATRSPWQARPFISLIELIYSGAIPVGSGFREVVVRVTIEHLDVLQATSDFDAVLQSCTEFTYDLSRAMISELQRERGQAIRNVFSAMVVTTPRVRTLPQYRCKPCRRSFSDQRALCQHDIDSHYYCSSCSQNFASRQRAKAHRKRVHGGY